MNLTTLMQAASSDPQAAAFIQQLLAGGTRPQMPEIPSMVNTPAPELPQMGEPAPMPVFDNAKSTLDELLGKWAPPAAGVDPSQFAQPSANGPMAAAPTDMLGQMAAPAPIGQQAIGYSPEQQAAGQAPPQSLDDLLAMLQGAIG